MGGCRCGKALDEIQGDVAAQHKGLQSRRVVTLQHLSQLVMMHHFVGDQAVAQAHFGPQALG